MTNMILLSAVFLSLAILETHCANHITTGISTAGEVEIRCVSDNYVKKIMAYNRDRLSDATISIIQNYKQGPYGCDGVAQSSVISGAAKEKRINTPECITTGRRIGGLIVRLKSKPKEEDLGKWECYFTDLTDNVDSKTLTDVLTKYNLPNSGYFNADGTPNDFTTELKVLDYDDVTKDVIMGCKLSTDLGTPPTMSEKQPYRSVHLTGDDRYYAEGDLYSRTSFSSTPYDCTGIPQNTNKYLYNCFNVAPNEYRSAAHRPPPFIALTAPSTPSNIILDNVAEKHAFTKHFFFPAEDKAVVDLRGKNVVISPLAVSDYTQIKMKYLSVQNAVFSPPEELINKLGEVLLKELSTATKFEIVNVDNNFAPTIPGDPYKMVMIADQSCVSGVNKNVIYTGLCKKSSSLSVITMTYFSSLDCDKTSHYAYIFYTGNEPREVEILPAGIQEAVGTPPDVTASNIPENSGGNDCESTTAQDVAKKLFGHLQTVCPTISLCQMPSTVRTVITDGECAQRPFICNNRALVEYHVPLTELTSGSPFANDWSCTAVDKQSPMKTWHKGLRTELACGLGDLKQKYIDNSLPLIVKQGKDSYKVVCSTPPSLCTDNGLTPPRLNKDDKTYTKEELMAPDDYACTDHFDRVEVKKSYELIQNHFGCEYKLYCKITPHNVRCYITNFPQCQTPAYISGTIGSDTIPNTALTPESLSVMFIKGGLVSTTSLDLSIWTIKGIKLAQFTTAADLPDACELAANNIQVTHNMDFTSAGKTVTFACINKLPLDNTCDISAGHSKDTQYKLEISNDGSNWVALAESTLAIDGSGVKTLTSTFSKEGGIFAEGDGVFSFLFYSLNDDAIRTMYTDRSNIQARCVKMFDSSSSTSTIKAVDYISYDTYRKSLVPEEPTVTTTTESPPPPTTTTRQIHSKEDFDRVKKELGEKLYHVLFFMGVLTVSVAGGVIILSFIGCLIMRKMEDAPQKTKYSV